MILNITRIIETYGKKQKSRTLGGILSFQVMVVHTQTIVPFDRLIQ